MRTAMGIVLLLGCVASAAAGDWPGWRGPSGSGRSDEKDLPLRWSGADKANVLWKVALPGQDPKNGQDQNQASPIVIGGRVFLTASYWPNSKPDPKAHPEHHVACYQAADGKLLWDVKVEPGPWLFSDLRGGYTAPTPAADKDRVYVVFGSSVIAALTHDGKPLWRKPITPYKFDVAIGASPILVDDSVILQCDQLDGQSNLAAFDRKTGDVQWVEKRPKASFSHSTPLLALVSGKRQLLVSASNALQGVDPANGKVLWWCDAKGDTVTPAFDGKLVYCDSGRGGPGVAVDPTGSGDVTKTHLKWTAPQVPQGFSSPVVVGDYLYRLHSPETIKCWKMATGEVMYSERLVGVSTSASPIATSDGRVYLASAGKTYILKAGPTLDVLATNDLGDDSHASPAVAEGRLFFKGRKWLFCVGPQSH